MPVRVETDVATFTAELAGIFRAAAERAGLRLTVDCPPLDRPACVDPRMWEKVVVNLLANAVKYTFVGGHRRRAARRRRPVRADRHRHRRRASSPRSCRSCSSASTGCRGHGPHPRGHRHRARAGPRAGRAARRRGRGDERARARAAPSPSPCPTARRRRGRGRPARALGRRPRRGGELGAGHRPGRPRPPAARGGANVLVVDDNADMRAYLTRLLGPHWRCGRRRTARRPSRRSRSARPTSC